MIDKYNNTKDLYFTKKVRYNIKNNKLLREAAGDNDIVSGFPVRQIIIWKRAGGFNFNAGYFLPTYEVIYLIAKSNFKLVSKANALGDIWEISQEMKNGHPAPFPVKLIDRIISSTNAKIILDPFMGSGTTAISAINFNRNYIGIDISPDYCESAEKRIKQHQSQSKLL